MHGLVIPNNEATTNLACIYLSFLHHAFDEETGRFRNFIGYDRRWLEEVGSEDSHGRAVWGLGEAVALAPSVEIRSAAQALFEKAVPALPGFSSPRAWAFALKGLHTYLSWFRGDSEVRRIRGILIDKIFDKYLETATDDWPWVEDQLAYANGKIAQAMILSGRSMGRSDILQAGLRSLEWLLEIQTDPKGHFVPVGNNGWYPRGGSKARFDQQPIEALNMIEACLEAFESTEDRKWISRAQKCFEWFLGRNVDYAAVIHHGIDLGRFTFRPDQGEYLLFFGRIHPEKGTAECIEVARRTGMKLIMAGIIQDQGYFDTKIRPYLDDNRIVYVGSAGPEKRDELLGGAYALLHPIGFDEPFGLSVVESMACGTPVVAFTRGSMPEIIAHGETGFLTENLDEMAQALNNVGDLDRHKCRQWVEARFSVERMVADYIRVYETWRVRRPGAKQPPSSTYPVSY